MRLNLGCGPHWSSAPDGWEHADRDDFGQPWLVDLTDTVYPWAFASIDVIVIHHVLHMLTPDDVRGALVRLADVIAPGGVVRIGERSMSAGILAHADGGAWLLDLIADSEEPTLDGKLFRWLTWHGTVRSLWSPGSLAQALIGAGFAEVAQATHATDVWAPGAAELDTRPWETFTLEARR